MTRTAVGFLALLALLPALQARDKAETPTPQQQYQALLTEFDKARMEFQKAFSEAKTQEDQRKVVEEKYPQTDKFAPRFLEFAEKNPKAPAAVDALIWVVAPPDQVVTPPSSKSDPDSPRTKALRILLRDHVQSEKLGNLCQSLGYVQDEESQPLLRAVLEKSRHRNVQAQACLALARQTETRLRQARLFKNDTKMAKQYEGMMGKEAVEKLVKADADKLSKEAEGFYQRIGKEFADVPGDRGDTMGKLAERRLETLRHPILVGKPAPEIAGEDIDGTKFKLSDYRGKVVLLDFWGNW
jgi:hypothetical protein